MDIAPTQSNFYEAIKPRLRRRIGRELRTAGRVLDLGCGSCDLARYLAERYQQRVTGVDIRPAFFPLGRVSSDGRVRCVPRDAAHLDFLDNEYMDAVVMMWSLHEMEQPDAVLREVRRVLRPGGELLVVDFPRDSLAQKLWNEDYACPAELKGRLVGAGLHNVKVNLIEREQIIWARGFGPAASRPGRRPIATATEAPLPSPLARA